MKARLPLVVGCGGAQEKGAGADTGGGPATEADTDTEWARPRALGSRREPMSEIVVQISPWSMSMERPFISRVSLEMSFFSICLDSPDASVSPWLRFFAPLDGAHLGEIHDTTHGMVRIAVRCRQCDAHLGHVFPDGPQPTGLRD